MREITVFATLVIAYSTAIALATRNLLTSNSLFPIAIASVILSARGVGWARKVAFAIIALGGFVTFERWLGLLGLDEHLQGVGAMATVLAEIYIIFTLTFPLVVLVLFVGRDPSVLWTPVASGEAKDTRSQRKPRSDRRSTTARGKR